MTDWPGSTPSARKPGSSSTSSACPPSVAATRNGSTPTSAASPACPSPIRWTWDPKPELTGVPSQPPSPPTRAGPTWYSWTGGIPPNCPLHPRTGSMPALSPPPTMASELCWKKSCPARPLLTTTVSSLSTPPSCGTVPWFMCPGTPRPTLRSIWCSSPPDASIPGSPTPGRWSWRKATPASIWWKATSASPANASSPTP